jgi:GT2 family glycosyltransferase
VSENPVISIVIVSFNKPAVLINTIKSIQNAVKTIPFELVIVDNASDDNNVDLITKHFPSVKLVLNSKNGGFANGCNVGAQNAIGKFLVFINSDIIIKGDPIPAMLDIFNSDQDTGIVGCQLLNPDESLQPSEFRFPKLYVRFLQLSGLKRIILGMLPEIKSRKEKYYETDYVSGAFLMIEKEIFFKVGCFDENYFMYHEDADICFKVKKLGKKVILYNYRGVIHLAQNKENLNNDFVFLNMNLGQIIFYKNNYSPLKLKLLAVMSIILFSCKDGIDLLLFKNMSGVVNRVIKLYTKALFNK